MRTIGQTLEEPLLVHAPSSRIEREGLIAQALERVGLTRDAAQRYPSSFSGGQRQRIAIARALLPRPRLLICDEPTSALDISIQAQILNLLRDVQRELGLSILFISHDLGAVRHVADDIVVLYQGQVLESGPAADVCGFPQHPYTQQLLAAVLDPDPLVQRLRHVDPAPPDPLELAAREGCPFRPRCRLATIECTRDPPDIAFGRRLIRCHHVREALEASAPIDPSHTAPSQGGLQRPVQTAMRRRPL
jgi:peptide/nickel transport system ATP-binding protein